MFSDFSSTESIRLIKWLATVFVLATVVVTFMVVLGLRNQSMPVVDSDEKAPEMVGATEREVSGASSR